MPVYTQTTRPEFSAIQSENGVIYHQRGGYELQREAEIFTPVNRSYRPLYPIHDGRLPSSDTYIANKLIHDTVPEDVELLAEERRISILGKTLLFLCHNESLGITQEYSSRYQGNKVLSEMARRAIGSIAEKLEDSGVNITLGLHGSHQVHVNGADSDLDLVAWVPRSDRAAAVDLFREKLEDLGFVNANHTNRFEEYAIRIASLTGLPIEIGAYLAGQRHRWISPEGTSTSLQLVHEDYQHEPVKQIIDSALSGKLTKTKHINRHLIELLKGSEPFNYPRLWYATYEGKEVRIISFNMVHQGMGTNGMSADELNEVCVISGDEYVDSNGNQVIILRDDGDYILPARLASPART